MVRAIHKRAITRKLCKCIDLIKKSTSPMSFQTVTTEITPLMSRHRGNLACYMFTEPLQGLKYRSRKGIGERKNEDLLG